MGVGRILKGLTRGTGFKKKLFDRIAVHVRPPLYLQILKLFKTRERGSRTLKKRFCKVLLHQLDTACGAPHITSALTMA